MGNRNQQKKAAKERREGVANKLKALASSVVVAPPTKDAASQQQQKAQQAAKSNQEDKFAPLSADDAVSARAEERAAHLQSKTVFMTPAERMQQQRQQLEAATTTTQSQAAGDKKSTKPPSTAAAIAAASNAGTAAKKTANNKAKDAGTENTSKKANQQDKNEDPAATTATTKEEEEEAAAAALSNRERKQRNRPTIETLKDVARNRPDLVELHDANAPDPVFLVTLKQLRNTVPVPSHWSQKSQFLSHRADRDASETFEDTVMPNWVQQMDLAQAWQTKHVHPKTLILPFVVGHPLPALTSFGDLFFEGKDMRARYHGYRPGVMSERLRKALDMGTSPVVPTPWLTGMQRVARLPPSYPNLKIPGVNAPLPSGAKYGRGRNEWGEPPRDPKNNNNFLYEGVNRSSANIQDAAERKFTAAKWGWTSSRGIFTTPKGEGDDAGGDQQGQTATNEDDAHAGDGDKHAVPTTTASSSAALPTVVVPEHALRAAGVLRNPDASTYQAAAAAQQGQWGVAVDTNQHHGAMSHLLQHQHHLAMQHQYGGVHHHHHLHHHQFHHHHHQYQQQYPPQR